VILKASELCPWTHTFAAQTFLDAGFPPGSVNVVMADRSSAADVTEAIIGHSSLRKVEFIGSAAVGKSIGAVAAKYLKPTLMELGDQSPAIIMKGADLKSAADVCAKGALALHGQVCFSFERIIVQSSIMNEFCQHLKAAFDNTPISGFAVSNASAEKAKAVIDDAIQRGAKLIYGDNKLTSPAALSPSILVDVPHDALISQHEAFAPTVFIATVETEQEAIDEANSREGGLFCSVFTERQDRGWSMAKELDFGMVQVNPKEVILDRKYFPHFSSYPP
jgi:acyl-CoA reductase-like NAD-dependent aldehyde dehydrogenase